MATRLEDGRRPPLPRRPEEVTLARPSKPLDWQRLLWILAGLALFALIYFSPPWPQVQDPAGRPFELTREGKAAIALFALALTWWVAEAIPIGITAVAVGVVQTLFWIRPARAAFTDFMHPAVWFVFASLVIGLTFTKTGLAKRIAYRILSWTGERTAMIYLGCSGTIAVLSLLMAHTAAAATVFPLLMAVLSLYEEGDRPSRFGKGLFIGMAFAAAAGSTTTLLGAARSPLALGFFQEIVGRDIMFFEFTYYMLPLSWGMMLLLWLYCWLVYPPEKKTIPGLQERARVLHARLGPMTRNEVLALAVVLSAVAALALRSTFPALYMLDRTAILLLTTPLFFILRVLTIQDLEEIPWNIVLLFGGAMSIGICLWETGAASWLAVLCLELGRNAHGVAFVLLLGIFVLALTNIVMNVAVIALLLPVALVMARYLAAAPEVVFYVMLATAGMPFMLLLGAAPNAIAFGSRQFTPGEFFRTGVPASLLLMAVLGLFVWLIWPLMGMPR